MSCGDWPLGGNPAPAAGFGIVALSPDRHSDPLLPVTGFSANDSSTLNLTFAHTEENATDADSSRSRMSTMNRQKIPSERLHSEAGY